MHAIHYTIEAGTKFGFSLRRKVDSEAATTLVDNVDANGPSPIADLNRIARRDFDNLRSILGWTDAGSLGPGERSALMSICDTPRPSLPWTVNPSLVNPNHPNMRRND